MRGHRFGRYRGQEPGRTCHTGSDANSAIDAAKAGAAIVHVHVHVRDPETGQASMAPELYQATAGRIKRSNTDVVLNLTTGYGGRISLGLNNPLDFGPGTTMTSPQRRIEHVLALNQKFAALTSRQ